MPNLADVHAYSNIPTELQNAEAWIVWGDYTDPRKGKAPRTPRQLNGLPGDCNAGVLHRTLPDALAAAERLAAREGWDEWGVGLAANAGEWVILDLDGCLDDPAALAFLLRLDTYVEISPSGTGYHAYLLGELPGIVGQPHLRGIRFKAQAFVTRGYTTVTGREPVGLSRRLRRMDPETVAMLSRHLEHAREDPDGENAAPELPEEWLGQENPVPVQEFAEDTSRETARVTIELRKLGFDRMQTFAALCNDPTIWDWALAKRQGDGARASQYLWEHHVLKTEQDHPELDGYGTPDDWWEDLDAEVEGAGEAGVADGGSWAPHVARLGDFTEEPPPREWTWAEWLPEGVVSGLAGPPGVSKSTFALGLCVHVVLGLDLIERPVKKGPALYLSLEDDRDELVRRGHAIVRHLQRHGQCKGMDELQDLWVMDVAASGIDPRLAHVTPSGEVLRTEGLKDFYRLMRTLKPRLVVLDMGRDFWDGSGNAETQVSAYVRQVLGVIAKKFECSLLFISHPSVASQQDNRPFSGSMAWLGSVRSAMSLTRDEPENPRSVLTLARVKANYGQLGEAKMEYAQGYVRPIPEGEQVQRGEADDQMLVGALPEDEWLGIRLVKNIWNGLGLPEMSERSVRRRLAHLCQEGLVDQKVEGGQQKWLRLI